MRVQELVDTLETKIQVIVQEIETEIKKPFQVDFEIPATHISQMCDIETRLMQLSTALDSVQIPYEAPIIKQPKVIQQKRAQSSMIQSLDELLPNFDKEVKFEEKPSS